MCFQILVTLAFSWSGKKGSRDMDLGGDREVGSGQEESPQDQGWSDVGQRSPHKEMKTQTHNLKQAFL